MLAGGQGSQYFGMGRALYHSDPQFRGTCQRAEAVAQDLCGRSVVRYIYDPDRTLDEACDDLVLSSVALVAVQVGLAELLERAQVRPSSVIGSSLGEFVALVVAGRLSLEDALHHVVGFAEVSREVLPAGWMAALTTQDAAALSRFVSAGRFELVAENSARHVVIAGRNQDWASTRRAAEQAGLTVTLLPVDHAFHTADVLPLRPRLAEITLQPAQGVEVIRCSTGAVLAGERLADPFHTLRAPMRLVPTVRALEPAQRSFLLDLSPGGGLAAALRLAGLGAGVWPIMTPFHQEAATIARIAESVGA